MTNPYVYIILLNWHGANDTVACLESLKLIDYPNYRVIVVDNGSTDDSVVQIRTSHPNIDIVETGENKGFSGGCNVGIRKALEDRADYVWLLNNDAIVDPSALTEMVIMAMKDRHIGVTGSVIYHMNDKQKIQAWGGGNVNFIFGRSRLATDAGYVGYISGASMLLSRAALKDCGLLDESYFMYWEDVDLCFRLKEHGYQLKVANNSRIYHKESASVGKGSILQDEYFNYSCSMFFKRHARFPLLSILVGTSGRIYKRLLRGELRRALRVLTSTWLGYCQVISKNHK